MLAQDEIHRRHEVVREEFRTIAFRTGAFTSPHKNRPDTRADTRADPALCRLTNSLVQMTRR